MNDFKDKLMVAVPLGATILLLTIVMSLLLWSHASKLRAVRGQLEAMQKKCASQIEEQKEQLSSKESAIQTLSDDLKKQGEEVANFKGALEASQKTIQEKDQSLDSNLDAQKQMSDDVLDRVKGMETSLKVLRTRCSRIEDDMHLIKGQTAEQDRQTSALREQFSLLQRALGISPTAQQGSNEETLKPTKLNNPNPEPRYPSD